LDDLLEVAGGRNVAEEFHHPYPSIDREMLLSLNPDVILQLLPGASAPALARAKAFWDSMPTLAAVRQRRVVVLTEPYVLQPGCHVGAVAEKFAKALHPSAATQPAVAVGRLDGGGGVNP